MLALLAAVAAVGAEATFTVVNPRPAVVSVLGGKAPCFATLYAPGWAVTTAACGSTAEHLRTDDGMMHQVRRTATDGRVMALSAPGAVANTYAPLGAWDFESAWTQRRAHAELVGLQGGVPVTVAAIAPPPEAPDRPDGMLSVSPSAGCPLVDGAPIFADDPDGQGSLFWSGVPMVGMVNAQASSCATFGVIAAASFAPLLTNWAGATRRSLLQQPTDGSSLITGATDAAGSTGTAVDTTATVATPTAPISMLSPPPPATPDKRTPDGGPPAPAAGGTPTDSSSSSTTPAVVSSTTSTPGVVVAIPSTTADASIPPPTAPPAESPAVMSPPRKAGTTPPMEMRMEGEVFIMRPRHRNSADYSSSDYSSDSPRSDGSSWVSAFVVVALLLALIAAFVAPLFMCMGPR